MKKISIALIFVLLFSLSSCNADEPITLDVDASAERMVSELSFYEELVELDDDMSRSLIGADDDIALEIAMYVGSGASADSVIVAKGDAETAYSVIEAYMDAQRELYSSYMIYEAAKIENAAKGKKDGYIIVCVTEDKDNAQKLIDEILK